MIAIPGKRRFTIDDILRLTSIGTVEVSSRGDIALTISRNDLEKNKISTEIHIVRRDGTSVFLVGEGDSLPRWSPSGRLLAFSSRRGAKEEEKGSGVFLWSGVGEPRKLVWFKYGVSEIKWLSDSQIIVNTSKPIEGLYDEDGDYVVADKLPLWFDGRGFIAGLYSTMYLLDVDSGYLRELVVEENKIVDIEVCRGAIYYAVPIDWRNPTIHKIIRLSPASGEKEVVLEGYSVSKLKCIRGKLYTLMHKNEIGIASHNKLWLVEEGEPECITCRIIDRNIHGVPGELDNKVLITYSDSGSILLATLDGEKIDTIAGKGAFVYTAHAEAGIVAYVLAKPTEPEELYVYDGERHRKITRFNEWILQEVELYRPVRETIKVEGEEIEGWIILPPTKSPHPLILYIHGGPKGMYGYNFYPEMQLMVAEGFAVAYANPRGSNGYTEEFADIRGRYGEVDYKQLVEFVHRVLEKYPIDRDKLAVTGISYGGYMTNVMITKTDIFRAAVSENGIADWIADFWASDIGYWFDQDQIGGTPHNNLEKYLEKSPAFYVDNVKTPLLLIHSGQDYRCFIDQALAMHVSLVLKGKESKLVVFREGSHGHSVRAKPRHRRKRYEIKIKWLKEKLGLRKE